MEASFRFIDAKNDTPLDQPREWRPARIVVGCPPERWESVRLTLQGIPVPLALRKIDGEAAIVAEWPRAGAGHYRLELDAAEFSASRTLTISPAKMSDASLSALLTDLEARLPLSIALKLQQGGALAGYQLPEANTSTIAQEVQRLRRALHGATDYRGLIAVLHELGRDPHVTLQRTGFWQLAERARRPPAIAIRQAMLVPGNLDLKRRPLRVIDERIDPHVDTPENRLLRLYHDQVERRLRRLLTHPDLGDAWRVELGGLRGELLRARRSAGWLDEVSPDAPVGDRISMVQLKRPPYRWALSGWLEFHRSVTVRFDDPALDAPLESLPDLYQWWGTLASIDALLDVSAALGYRSERQQLFGLDMQGVFLRLFPDQEALSLNNDRTGARIRLLVKPRFGKSGDIRSVTYMQEPDIVMDVIDATGGRRLIVLDPKYKLDGDEESGDGRPTKTDIDKMHAYRDAIRDAEGRRIVSHAAILYPGPGVRWDHGIAALTAIPISAHTLHTELLTLFQSTLSPDPPPLP